MNFAIVNNATNIVVREFGSGPDYVAPTHKFGPGKQDRVVRVLEAEPPTLEAGQELQRATEELTETELRRGWIAVARPAPQEVARWALREICEDRGHKEAIELAFDKLPADVQRKARGRWNSKDTISRGSSMITALQALLGWSNAYVDELFVAADTLAKS